MENVNPLTDRPVGIVPLHEVLAQPGVEFLRAISAGRYPMPPMAAVIPMAPGQIDEGYVVFRAVPESRFYNPIGSVHGGYASTLLDTAMGCAVHSTLPAGEGYTTLEIKIAFHKPITHATGELRIEGTVVSRGARVASATGRITDAKGELLASGTTTCLVFRSDPRRLPEPGQVTATTASPTDPAAGSRDTHPAPRPPECREGSAPPSR